MKAARPLKNYVLRNRQSLEERNYILKGKPKDRYWVAVTKSVLDKYIVAHGKRFNIVIFGDDNIEGDFYWMPYAAVQRLLTKETLAHVTNDQVRWIWSIQYHRLKITNADALDISKYYGRLPGPEKVPRQTKKEEDEENDFAIENRTAEIQQRVKQSVFRNRVLANFRSQCCLTGITELELLVASHIVPWAERIDSRLDPGNGICLSVLYDRLFDGGFITLDAGLRVIVTSHTDSLSKPLVEVLKRIAGKQAAYPVKTKIKAEYLAYHRNIVFRG